MATKNILLAIADPQTVVDINQALGGEWLTTHVASEADALAMLEASAFDALLVDFNLASPDASELLNAAGEKCPDTHRFLFVYEADLALVAAKVQGEHEILPKPLDPASLKSRIEKAFDEPIATEVGLATGFDTASPIPTVYDEVLKALETPEVTCQQIGELIAQDDRLLQEVLTLTRSTYQGLPSKITEPVEAVEVLGLQTVKALVMALRFLAEHSHVRPGYLSLEKIWQHSTGVAQIARDLVLFETKDRALASQALAAGLVHDLGKVVLATNFDDLYGRVHSLARKQPVALWEIEKEMFGASHGEIGACLLGMWNLPSAVVDAAAFHHEPPPGELGQLTPLAAVHIANVLEQQLRPNDEFRVVPVVNTPFLNQLGLLQRLPVWRATIAKQLSQPKPVEQPDPLAWVAAILENGPASRTTNHLPGPAAETRTTTAAPANQAGAAAHVRRSRPERWLYAGFGAILLFSMAAMFQLGRDSSQPTHVNARAIADQQPVMTAAFPVPSVETPAVETAPVAEPPPATATTPVTAEASVANAAPLPVTAVVAEVLVTNLSPAETASQPVVAPPAFRLNGIFYTATRPSAIVNGKTVFVGEQVNGAKVVSIGRDEVTLETSGETKILSVPGAGSAH